MRPRILGILLAGGLGLLPAIGTGEAPAARVAVGHSLVLKVADRDVAADHAIALTEKLGGYFLTRADDAVVLKIPVRLAGELVESLLPLGVVVARTSQAEDLGEALDEQRTRLASREGMLKRYFEVMNAADLDQVAEVEQAMTSLVQEIESLKGRLRLLQHQLQKATIEVRFEFKDRRAPVGDGRSSFAWLNKLDLSYLIAEFGHE